MPTRRPRGHLRNKSTAQVRRLLLEYGFHLVKPGPHERWEKEEAGRRRVVIVPAGRTAIAPKTLASILEQAGISKDEARRFWAE